MNVSQLFESLTPMQDKKVAVVLGRFNPPQIGHYKLINDVKSWINKNSKLGIEALPIVVIIGGGKSDKDTKRNPLSLEDRVSFMQSSGRCNGIKIITATNAFAAFEEVRKAGFEPIAVAAGSDRINEYVKILDKYYVDKSEKQIKHYAIGLDRDEKATETNKDKKHRDLVAIIKDMQDGDDPKIDEISASLARVAVEMNAKEEFTKIVGLEKNQKLADQMFNKIKSSMGVE